MAQATLSCPYGAIHLENRWGTASVSTYAQRVLTGGLPYPLWPFGPSPPDRGSRPQTPCFTGVPYCGTGSFIRRAKSEWRPPLAAGPLGPENAKFGEPVR